MTVFVTARETPIGELPCHRVIRGDGTWDGYAYGNHRKRWLLRHEAKRSAE